MKKYLFLILAVAFISCNDDGGERDGMYRPIIQKTKTLPAQYAAVGIGLSLAGLSLVIRKKRS